MKSILTGTALAAVVLAGSISSAAAGSLFFYPHYYDGSQAYNSRVIAGAAPNAYSTFIYGARCSYEYRYVGGARVRYQVCN